jgi:hypothetical protein
MYAFGNRPDFAIWDEPFYAPYLAATGVVHPMGDEIMAAHETDPAKVAAACIGPIPAQKPHFYMKHMPHHMITGFPIDWAADCVNVHLIRHPARVIASYSAKRENPTAEDLGFARQVEIHAQFGGPVIDADDIRADPRRVLTALCDRIGLPFDEAILKWPKGPRSEDGVWARHWYGAIHQTTGFAGAEGPLPEIPPDQTALLEICLPHYERLAAEKL